MADLLRTWLVDEVQLSRDVVSFEKECANGYLIAEVLAKHNQQPDFAEGAFRDDDRADTQVSNFVKIEPTLVRLGIRFDARRARLLMSQQRNAALTLLYEIKTAVAPLNKVAVSLRPPPSGGIKAARLGLRARAAPHDKAQSELFAKSIRLKADNQNELFLNKHMRNFGRGVERLWAQRDAMARARAGAHKAALNQQRLRQLHLLRTNRMLRAAKEEHGVREWQRNMEVRLAQGQRAKRIDQEQKLRAAEQAELSDMEAAADMSEGLAGFESAARRLGIEMEATGKEGPSEEEEAAELMHIARRLRRTGPARPSSGPTRLAEQEAYFDAMEERLGTRQANAASAEAILRRLRRRKLDADELHDKRRRRRAAFVAAGGALRASRLEAERRRWLASFLRSRSKAEAQLDSECADIARLEGEMRLRRARADEDMAVQALRDEAAALRWDGELWAAATAAHALEAASVCRRLDALRAERRESRRQAVEAMCRDEAMRLVETALAAASVREAFSQLGHVGQGWEAVAQGSVPSAVALGLAGPAADDGASMDAAGSEAATSDAAEAGTREPVAAVPTDDAAAGGSSLWEGQAGVGVELWDRLVGCAAAGVSPWLALPKAPAKSDVAEEAVDAETALVSLSGSVTGDAWPTRAQDEAMAREGDAAAAVRLELRARVFLDLLGGRNLWAGLSDGSSEAARLDALVTALCLQAAASDEDAEPDAGKGGAKAKKAAAAAADKKRAKKGGSGKGGAAADAAADGAEGSGPVPKSIVRALLGAALGDAFMVDDGTLASNASAAPTTAAAAVAEAAAAAGDGGDEGTAKPTVLPPAAAAVGPFRSVLGRCVEELRLACIAPKDPPAPASGVPWGLPLRACCLAPPFAPLSALCDRLAGAFGLRSVDPWLLLVEGRCLAAAAARASPAGSDAGGELIEATLRIQAVDDIMADDRAAEANEDDSEGKDADDSLPSGPLDSLHPEKGEDASFAQLLSGRDALAALAAENCDPNCDTVLRRLVMSPEQVTLDSCSLGPRWAAELASVGQEAAAAEAAARAAGADMRWWCPADELLVRAVHIALKALTADVAEAAEAAGGGSTPGGSPIAAEQREEAEDGSSKGDAAPEWREGLEEAAREAGLRGWLLVGFPRSSEQAAALEVLLTGWTPRVPATSPWTTFDASAADARWGEACAPVDEEAAVLRPDDAIKQHSPRGVLTTLRLDTDAFRAARYALGWRADPVMQAMPALPEGEDAPLASTSRLPPPKPGVLAPGSPDAGHDTTAAPPRPSSAAERPLSAASRTPLVAVAGRAAPVAHSGSAAPAVGPIAGFSELRPSSAGGRETDGKLVPPSARDRPSALPLELPVEHDAADASVPPGSNGADSVGERPCQTGPRPWVWSPRTERPATAEAGALAEPAAGASDALVDEVRAAAFASGYIPTLRSGPPLYHVDVLPPPFALDHKGALERAAISSAAARSMEAALMRREGGAREASTDAWFERAGALRVLRWHKPAMESRAREELERGDCDDRMRKRALADVAALDAEAASSAGARRDDDAHPRCEGNWLLLRGTAACSGSDQQVVDAESWAEFEAPGRCLWAVGRRDLLADHDLFSAAARALAHGFRDGHERAQRSAAAAAAEVDRRSAALESLRGAFKSFLSSAEGVQDAPAPQEPAPTEAPAGDGDDAPAEAKASPRADEAAAEGAIASAGPIEEGEAGAAAHSVEAEPRATPHQVRRPDLQPPLLPGWLAACSTAQQGNYEDAVTSGGDSGAGDFVSGGADDVTEDAEAADGDEAAGVEQAAETDVAEAGTAAAGVDAAAASAAPVAGAEEGDKAAAAAAATIDSNEAVVETRQALALASVPVGLRVPVMVLPSWSSKEQATHSAVTLARAAASSILRRWDTATRAYGATAETHAWRWGRELEAAAGRSARVAGAFAQSMCAPFDGYDEALQRLFKAICRVPASSRSRPEVQAALEADVDAVAAGMRVAAGKRFAAASELATSVSVQGWADAALWSLTASALAIASAERRRLAEARAALLQYAIMAGGAVPVGAAPDGAEAMHACAVLRLAGTTGLSTLADAIEAGPATDEAAEAEAAGGGGAAAKAKAGAAKDKAAAAKKKGGAASAKDKKKGKAGAGAGDDDEEEDAVIGSAEVGVPAAADFAWRVGHLSPPVVLPASLACLAAAPPADGDAPPESGESDAQAAVQALVSACGEDESQLEAEVLARRMARVEAAAAASLALAVGALVRDAVGPLLPFEVPAAAGVPGPAVSAAHLGGGAAAEAGEQPSARSIAWGTATRAMAEAEAFAAAVVWDSSRLRRVRARVGHALAKAEKRRTAAAAAARAAVEHVEAEAQAELDAAAAALAEAQAAGGKDKKKGGAASKKDKKQAAAAGPELPDMSEVLLPLSSVLPIPPVPAAAALAAGCVVGEEELASLTGLEPVALGRALVAGRAAAQLRAEARMPDSVLSALEAEARHSAGRLRVLRRALGRAAERIASFAAQNTLQAEATAEARLRGELSAIASARNELVRDVKLGRVPVAPLRVQTRLARSEELLLPVVGAGGNALGFTSCMGPDAVDAPAARHAVVVELKQLRSCRQVTVLAEASTAREAPGTDGLTPSGFGVLVSALRAVAEHSGNPALMLPAVGSISVAEPEESADWASVFEDSVPPAKVRFGPDGAPLAETLLDTAEGEAAAASGADTTAASVDASEAGEEVAGIEGSTPHPAAAMAPAVPAGAWAPEAEVVATLLRLAGAGKLGALWREAARASTIGGPLAQWVAEHRVRPDEWPGAAVQQAARGEPHWVDWRRLCTAALFSAPTDGEADSEEDAPVEARDASDAAVAAMPRVAASGAVLSAVPSADETRAFAGRLANACGLDAERLASDVEHPLRCDAICGPEVACVGVRPWFEGHGLHAIANAEASGTAAEARLQQRVDDLDAVAACESVPPELASSEPRLTDGLGGWHQLPTPHPVLAAATAAAGARVRSMRLRAAAALATDRRLTSEDAAHMTSDALDASLGKALYKLWTDSSGTTRWGRMLFTLRTLASAPVPLGPSLAATPANDATAPAPVADAAPLPPRAAASAAAGPPKLMESLAAPRAACAAGALHADAVAVAEASALAAAVAAAGAAEASTGKGSKGSKRK